MKTLEQQIAERRAVMERLLEKQRAEGQVGVPAQYEALARGLAVMEQRLEEETQRAQARAAKSAAAHEKPLIFEFPYADGRAHRVTENDVARGLAPRVVGNLPTVAGQWNYTDEGIEARYTREELETALRVHGALRDILED